MTASSEATRLSSPAPPLLVNRESLLAEAHLQAMRLNAIVENTDAHLALLDRDFRFVLVNSTYANSSRHSREDLLGRGHFDLFPDEENEAIFRRVRDTGEPFRAVEKPFEFADQPERGATYWNWILVPMKGPSGDVSGLLLSLVDVTPQVVARRRIEDLAEERRRSEEALKESEERYRSLYRSMSEGVVLHELLYDAAGTPVDYRLLEANLAFETITGIPFERVRGQLASTAYGTGQAPYLDIYARVAITGEPASFETTFDPMAKTFSISVFSPARGQFATVFQDITERKRAEAERERFTCQIDEQRRLFQAVVDNAPVGIAVLRGADLVCEVVNHTFQAMAPGRPMAGRRFVEAWPELHQNTLPILQGVMATGDPYHSVDARYLVHTGEEDSPQERYVSSTFLRIQPAADEEPALLLITRETTPEVTARHRIEQLARLAQHRASELETALRSMTDAVFVCDSQGTVILANDAALRLTGASGSPNGLSLNHYLARLRLHSRDGRSVSQDEMAIAHALGGETVHQREEVGIHPVTGAEIDLLISAAPIRDENGEVAGAVHVARDITEMMELDRLKDQFISIAAHELKTPLTILKGYSQILLRGRHVVAPDLHRALDGIDRGAGRIDRIVRAVLDASLVASNSMRLSPERMDLGDFVEQKVERTADATAWCRFKLSRPGPLPVLTDPVRLEQVLDTLLDNAIRYSTSGHPTDRCEIEVDARLEGNWALVAVKDSGIGIPENRQGRIFQRFYRAHADSSHDYGGLGIGLYVARSIVALHGGHMSFESREGDGSTFRFTLPVERTDGA